MIARYSDPCKFQEALAAWETVGQDCDGSMPIYFVGEGILRCLEVPGMAYDLVELRPNRPTPKQF
jgi:hypothetical protein